MFGSVLINIDLAASLSILKDIAKGNCSTEFQIVDENVAVF